MKRVLLSWALISAASVTATPSVAAQEAVKVDYVRSRAIMGGEAEILEEGSLYFASDGRFRRDIQRRGEMLTEILLAESRQRITMNHSLQVVQVGALQGQWPIPSRYVPARPEPPPGHRVPDAGPEQRRYMLPYENLGQRGIGGIIASGGRNARVLPDGRRTIVDIWLTPLSRLEPVPIKVEGVVVSYDADGRETFREQMQVVSTVRVPLDDSLFEPVRAYEEQEMPSVRGPRPRIQR